MGALVLHWEAEGTKVEGVFGLVDYSKYEQSQNQNTVILTKSLS